MVLLGRGRLRFAPSNAAERTQVRIFGGEETLDAEFDAVLVRVRPAPFSLAGIASVRFTSVLRLRRPLRRPAGLPDWAGRNWLCLGGLP